MAQGTVKWFSPDKGYGFIDPGPDEEDLFFHIRDVERGTDEAALAERARVEFEISSNHKGPSARRVRLAGAQPVAEPQETQPAYTFDEALKGLRDCLLAAAEWIDIIEDLRKNGQA